jgi:hypothetical protein
MPGTPQERPPRRKRGFLDEPEPEWVERLKENRKAQVKQWEQVMGTEGSAQSSADEEGIEPDRPPAQTAPRRKLRRTSHTDRRETPAFYDQDEDTP